MKQYSILDLLCIVARTDIPSGFTEIVAYQGAGFKARFVALVIASICYTSKTLTPIVFVILLPFFFSHLSASISARRCNSSAVTSAVLP